MTWPGKRIAVIENEVGAVSIDHALIAKALTGRPAELVQELAQDRIYVLKNGCMCCRFGQQRVS